MLEIILVFNSFVGSSQYAFCLFLLLETAGSAADQLAQVAAFM
jgi:hypothetical protein